jgi:hypothetical protein
MLKEIIYAMLFSLALHLLVVGGGFIFFEFQRRQTLKQGAFASGYGVQFSGLSLFITLLITYVVVAVLFAAVRSVIRLVN